MLIKNFVSSCGLTLLGAAKNSTPWTPVKGLVSGPRLHDKPVKDDATIPIL